MINSYFDNLPKLTKKEACELLSKNIDSINLSSDYYKAVFHLAKYPCSEVEDKLIAFLNLPSDEMPIQIAKRKERQ